MSTLQANVNSMSTVLASSAERTAGSANPVDDDPARSDTGCTGHDKAVTTAPTQEGSVQFQDRAPFDPESFPELVIGQLTLGGIDGEFADLGREVELAQAHS